MKNNLFDLSGQVAFCCGGSSGLGLQFAKAMANAGADIALVARRTDRLDENAREIEAEYGVKVYPHYMDLQDSKSITDCVSDVVAHFGKIDILVNAAGIPGGGDPATLTDEYWLNVINTDLNGQFFTCREVVRQSMKPNQYGRIIMVSSIHGVCGRKGVDTAPYAAAKGGIVIAIAIACRPKILICDEPTTALDVTIQAQIMDLLAEIKHDTNTAIILITHDLGVVAGMADRVAVMYAGKIVETGTVEDIFYRNSHPYTQALLKSLPTVDADKKERLVSIAGTPPDLLNPPKGCGFGARCKHCMKICQEEQPPEFTVGEGHVASCWLLHPDCPSAEERGEKIVD